MWIVQVILIIISIYMAYTMKPKSAVAKPQAFEDFDFPQAESGTPQCVVFGDQWTGDWVVIALGDYRTSSIKTSSGK